MIRMFIPGVWKSNRKKLSRTILERNKYVHLSQDIVEDDDKNESSDEEDEAIGWTFQRRNCWFCLQSSPVSEKKAKLISPVESLKKGDACKREGHSATPRPAKQGNNLFSSSCLSTRHPLQL
ncbi:histone deacetylase HDT2-like isoform X4 [Musa acuminata AAA Group]|uniref:histone deacetylase HDT2-like isoform X4 n=1 Tax=Musa acuminata AAA Group TaxID=214697 RepID=UPI0031D38CD3